MVGYEIDSHAGRNAKCPVENLKFRCALCTSDGASEDLNEESDDDGDKKKRPLKNVGKLGTVSK